MALPVMSSVASTSPTKPTLANLPPELLLDIISFLPCFSHAPSFPTRSTHRTSSYRKSTSIPHHQTIFSLLLTSHSISAFVTKHLSAIFNTHIRLHYATTSAYFHPSIQNSNGWFVPQRDTPSRLRGFTTYLNHADASVLRSTRADQENDLITNKEGWNSHLVELSQPSPLFARFLEEYDFDIRVHIEVVKAKVRAERIREAGAVSVSVHGQHVAGTVMATTGSTTDGGVDGAGITSEANREDVILGSYPNHPDLAFRLGQYCVRPFLMKINGRRRDAYMQATDVEAAEDGHGLPEEREEMLLVDERFERLKRILRCIAWPRRSNGNRGGDASPTACKVEKRRLCFGEIEPETDEEEDEEKKDRNEKEARIKSRWRKLTCGVRLCRRSQKEERCHGETEGENDGESTIAEGEKPDMVQDGKTTEFRKRLARRVRGRLRSSRAIFVRLRVGSGGFEVLG